MSVARNALQLLVVTAFTGLPLAALAAKPSAKDALDLRPVQKDVEYDIPDAKEIEKCSVEVIKVGGFTGYAVTTDSGQLLRRFLDTNGDNRVDQWCYFKDGIEVYRDIDGNFNNKADQYRWLGTAGTRWGLDDDENGKIDSWKVISAEEVTGEVVAALRDRDAARFQRLLLSSSDLQSLGLGSKQVTELGDKIEAAVKSFMAEAGRQKIVTAKSEWVHFGANRPGIVPAGTEGSTKDIIVYDNVTAVVETDKKHGQLNVGTLVKVGDAWKLFDLPKMGADQAANAAGYFFTVSFTNRPDIEAPIPAGNVTAEMKKLVDDLEQLDKRLVAAKPSDQARLNASRADLLDKIIAVAPADDRGLWIRQYAETVSAAIQSGVFPEGIRRLQSLLTAVAQQPDANELVPYIKFRLLTSEYNRDVGQKDADFEKITNTYQDELKQFVNSYSRSPDAAEAMLQLAIGAEFSGKTDDAINWFSRIASDFPQSDLKSKAVGAKRRLESVGKTIPLSGKMLDGKSFDLTSAKGKVVLVHYWATWADPCKPDLATIKSMQAKYGQGFLPVGVNLDGEAKEAVAYARQEKLSWPQLYEPGGLDSPLAVNLGVLTLPTMILIGKDGRVINRSINAGELDAELKKLLSR
jgi:thiol-disulfide isomerase/thioredoxin